MLSDSAFFTQCEKNLSLLLYASGGNWSAIPRDYLEYFHHNFSDGSISLVPAISKLSNTCFLESWEISEVVESLMKVRPEEWPNIEDIVSIDAEKVTQESFSDEALLDYVEDNLGTAEKTEKVLKCVIESVIGKGVNAIRCRKGRYPCPDNNFLQEDDGTFSGTFMFEGFRFSFEVAPRESGWLCTYRLSEKSLDQLEEPEFKVQRERGKTQHRSVRTRAWGG